MDEWKLLQLETTHIKARGKKIHVDHWRDIFKIKCCRMLGASRYPQLEQVVKAALTLAHGSIDVKKDFSISVKISIPDKVQMKVRTLNAKLYEYVKEAGAKTMSE